MKKHTSIVTRKDLSHVLGQLARRFDDATKLQSLLRLRVPCTYVYKSDALMDKFVTITKPTALSNNGKADACKRKFKYNPYPIPAAKERQVTAWRDKKRTEK